MPQGQALDHGPVVGLDPAALLKDLPQGRVAPRRPGGATLGELLLCDQASLQGQDAEDQVGIVNGELLGHDGISGRTKKGPPAIPSLPTAQKSSPSPQSRGHPNLEHAPRKSKSAFSLLLPSP